MSNHQQFIDDSKKHLDRLSGELDHLDQQLKTAGSKVDTWYGEQMQTLRDQWNEANSHVEKLTAETQSQAEAFVDQAKEDADRHWKALQAAVKTYRTLVDRNFPKT